MGDLGTVSARGGVGTLARAALPSLPVVGTLPGVRKHGGEFDGLTVRRPPVTVARDDVEAYARVCGFPVKDVAPLTYPHLLAFPLHMALMSDPSFPAPAIGTVHLDNAITQHRPVAPGETVEVSAAVGPALPHPRGQVFEFRTTVLADGAPVWESVSGYLRRGAGEPSAATRMGDLPDAVPGGTRWRLPADLGRRYAAVSGDYNPIHLFPLTARALGFKRQIAHGMWTTARCVAALENRLPDAVRVEVAFRKPVFLPGTVAFGARPLGAGLAFSLTRPDGDAVHLVGRTSAL